MRLVEMKPVNVINLWVCCETCSIDFMHCSLHEAVMNAYTFSKMGLLFVYKGHSVILATFLDMMQQYITLGLWFLDQIALSIANLFQFDYLLEESLGRDQHPRETEKKTRTTSRHKPNQFCINHTIQDIVRSCCLPRRSLEILALWENQSSKHPIILVLPVMS